MLALLTQVLGHFQFLEKTREAADNLSSHCLSRTWILQSSSPVACPFPPTGEAAHIPFKLETITL